MTNGGQRTEGRGQTSEIRGQLYSAPAELKVADCLEIWKRLNGRLMTVAEKELYESVCRRLSCNLARPMIVARDEGSEDPLLSHDPELCDVCIAAAAAARRQAGVENAS